ncbi:hypothetical protein ATCC90586_007535 [Pythium insidiosum]|nr:hypothetical protein ATCC90586_007535 [Pythium insidiosum]
MAQDDPLALPLFARGVAVQVLPPRRQSRDRDRASPLVMLSVRHPQRRLQHIARSMDELLDLWGNVHAVLSGRPRNALVAALSIGRDGCGAIETLRTADCCVACGLSHLPLLLEGLRDVAVSEDKKPTTLPMLSRPAPRRSDVSMSNARLRTVTLNAFVQELVVAMSELERQRVLLVKCPHLDGLHKAVAVFFQLDPPTTADARSGPQTSVEQHSSLKALDVNGVVFAETPTNEVRNLLQLSATGHGNLASYSYYTTMGSGASTLSGVALQSASVDDQEDLSLEQLYDWIRSQNAGQTGQDLIERFRTSGLSAGELLLLMDQETLLPTLGLEALGDEQRKTVLSLVRAGRDSLRREFRVTLKELPDAMDKVVYVLERFPLVLDPAGQATRFLKYQRSAVLMVGNPADMTPESLRRHLVGALRHGTWLILDFDSLVTVEIEAFFSPDHFPREILSRQALFRPEVYTRLLRPEAGDPTADVFLVNDQFKFIVLCRGESPPPKTALAMCVLRVDTASSTRVSDEEQPSGENDSLARALGVSKETKRNSMELVEAAFDGEIDVVRKCLDQNYDVDSADGHKHTALSEAACKGNNDILVLLLERGADPNKVSDEKRSPLYRAAYNGHLQTVSLLLESGADPRILSKQSESAFDVAKTEEVRQCIQSWDVRKTESLLEQRREIIERQWQERIVNHVERERYALMKIHEELVELARSGAADELEARLEQLVDEAIEANEKPRASADVRDDKGATLLSIAAQQDHDAVVSLLLTKWKAWKASADESAGQRLVGGQKANVKKQELMAKALKANVNARDCRGWTPVAIAVFHESKKCLRLLLDNGADPKLKNQYNKNAFDFAKDDIDAALNVVKSRAESQMPSPMVTSAPWFDAPPSNRPPRTPSPEETAMAAYLTRKFHTLQLFLLAGYGIMCLLSGLLICYLRHNRSVARKGSASAARKIILPAFEPLLWILGGATAVYTTYFATALAVQLYTTDISKLATEFFYSGRQFVFVIVVVFMFQKSVSIPALRRSVYVAFMLSTYTIPIVWYMVNQGNPDSFYTVVTTARALLLLLYAYIFVYPPCRASKRTIREYAVFTFIYYTLLFLYNDMFRQKRLELGFALTYANLLWGSMCPLVIWRVLKADTEHWRGMGQRAVALQSLFRQKNDVDERVSSRGLHVLIEMHRRFIIDFAYLEIKDKIGDGTSAIVFSGVLHSNIPLGQRFWLPKSQKKRGRKKAQKTVTTVLGESTSGSLRASLLYADPAGGLSTPFEAFDHIAVDISDPRANDP